MKSKLSVKNKKRHKTYGYTQKTYIIYNFDYVFSKLNFDESHASVIFSYLSYRLN